MSAKFTKLVKLVRTGDYAKIKHALQLRLNRFVGGHDLRAEIARYERETERALWENFGIDNRYRDGTIKVAAIIYGVRVMPWSSAFIRLIAPLTHPSLKDKVSLKLYPEDTVEIDPATDVCIVQRTAFDRLGAAKRLIGFLRQNDVEFVLDTDDAFDQLEKNHNQYEQQIKRIKAFNYVAEVADRIWLSTPRLSESLPEPDKHVIIQNTLDERLWPLDETPRQPSADTPLELLYMGTASHYHDFGLVLPVLDDLTARHPGSFRLSIVGVTDEELERGREWMRRIPWPEFGTMYPNFVPWLRSLGPFDAGLAPLTDTAFNRAKSDIKCLDYLGAGIIPVVSDVEAYSTPELGEYIIKTPNTAGGWLETLENIVQSLHDFRNQKPDTIAQARNYISKQRSSEQAGQRMYDELRTLLNQSGPDG